MRRREITSESELFEIIGRCQWCHMGMADTNANPYVVPMNFGFRDRTVYLHGARHGKKISFLTANPRVCLNFSTDHLLRYQNENVACSWSMKYRSVIVYGNAEFIEDVDEKTAALEIIMSQYTANSFKFNPPSLREVNVWKVRIETIEGRSFGY